MMRTVNCTTPKSNLWEYNIDIDQRAAALAILRPVVMIGTSLCVGAEPAFSAFVTELRIDSDAVRREVLSLQAENSARGRDLIRQGRDLYTIYVSCVSFELKLKNQFVQTGISSMPRPHQKSDGCTSSSNCAVVVCKILSFVRPKYLKTKLRPLCIADLTRDSVPLGEVFYRHNGVEGVSGHFNASVSNAVQAKMMHLGAPVIPSGARRGSASGADSKYDRHEFKESWFVKFPWLRTDEHRVWCACCKLFPQICSNSLISKGELPILKVRVDRLRIHDEDFKHIASMAALERQEQAKGQPHRVLRALERHLTITTGREIVERLIVTFGAILLHDIPFSKMEALVAMQTKNGLQMGGGAYTNHTFYDEVIEIMAAVFERRHSAKLLRSAEKAGLWLSGDGSGSVTNEELEIICVGYWDWDTHTANYDFSSVEGILLDKSKDGKSPDANAIFETQMVGFERKLGPKYRDILATSVVCASFDGASVMLGAKDSVSTRWADLPPQKNVIHAVAHRLESAYADACSEVAYLRILVNLSRMCTVCTTLR